MSNYLKKLAYVHEAMKKMAAPNNVPGMSIGMPVGYSPNLSPVAELRKMQVSNNTEVMPPKPTATVKPGVAKPVAPTAAAGTTNTLTDDQRRQNVVNYQRELVNRMVATGRFGKGPDAQEKAKNSLRRAGRWYATRDLSQYSGKRFNSIANGTRGYMKVKGEQAPYNAFNGYAASSGNMVTKPPVPTRSKIPNSVASQMQMRPVAPINSLAPVSDQIPGSSSPVYRTPEGGWPTLPEAEWAIAKGIPSGKLRGTPLDVITGKPMKYPYVDPGEAAPSSYSPNISDLMGGFDNWIYYTPPEDDDHLPPPPLT